ncbi:MAG: fibronectin type III domain-containing protein [Comamonadaceae bacterium]|nr:fibronectin type III domain-containing protein [Comamonadaceae bacterium]
MKNKFKVGAITLLIAAGSPLVWGGPFSPGNVVVYRFDGGATKTAQPVSLLELSPEGTLVQTLSLPSTGAGAGVLTASDTRSEGLLNRSADGRCLAVPGYSVVAGTTPLVDAATAAPRRVLLIGATGEQIGGVTFGSTASSAFMGDSIRSAVSNDCTQVWASGAGSASATRGLWYAPNGSLPASNVQLSTTNAQGIQIAAGQLYAAFAGGGTVNKFGVNLPTSVPSPSSTVVPLPGMPANNFRGLALLKLGNGPAALDTAYVANNNASTPAIEKYVFNGTAWVASGRMPVADAHGVLALDTGGGQVLLFATGSDGRVYRAFDRSGFAASVSASWTSIAAVDTEQTPQARLFGLALTPEAAPPAAAPNVPASASMSAAVGGLSVQWSAPASGAAVAWYVLELSNDNFATVAREHFVPAGGSTLSRTITGLGNGTYRFRVRAVNSKGGSAHVTDGSTVVIQPPTISGLADQLALSGVIGDATDPAAINGLMFEVSDTSDAPVSIQVRAESSNTTVVPASGLEIVRSGANVTLKIAASSVGFADITVTATNSRGLAVTRTLRYAASQAVSATASTRWYTGRSDGSTGAMLNGGALVLVGDDEAPAADLSGQPLPGGNALWAYPRSGSGSPVALAAIDGALGLNDIASCALTGVTGTTSNCRADGEVDLEASMRLGNRLYVTGSHSNNKSGNSRADRWRLFAADINDGAAPSMDVKGYYRWLREDLRAWDTANGHRFGLVAGSNGGGIPESESRDGFSIEGLSSSPDNGAAWFAFRAPLVPAPGQPAPVFGNADGRNFALIVSVNNFDALATASGGGSLGSAQFGNPIWLDLGGRAIREISKNDAGQYLIIAGPPGSATGVSPKDFRLYSWDGSADSNGLATNLRPRGTSLASLNPNMTGCSPEGFAELPANMNEGGQTGLISDCGDAIFYTGDTVAKDLQFNAWKKFRSDDVVLDTLATAAVTATVSEATGLNASVTASQAGQFYWVVLPASAPTPSLGQVVSGLDGTGSPSAFSGQLAVASASPGSISASGLLASETYKLYGVVVVGDTPGVMAIVSLQRLALGVAGGVQAVLSGDHGWAFAPVGSGPMDSGGWIAASGAPKSPPSLPPGYSFPYGLLDFVAVNGDADSMLTARFTLPSPVPMGAVLWKYGATAANPQAHWYMLPQGEEGQPGSYSLSQDRKTLTLRIADGGLGDSALDAKNLIADPSGIGIPSATEANMVPVPTLSQWSLMFLAAGVMVLVWRKKASL